MEGGAEGEAVDETRVGAHQGAVPVGTGIQESYVPLLDGGETTLRAGPTLVAWI